MTSGGLSLLGHVGAGLLARRPFSGLVRRGLGHASSFANEVERLNDRGDADFERIDAIADKWSERLQRKARKVTGEDADVKIAQIFTREAG